MQRLWWMCVLHTFALASSADQPLTSVADQEAEADARQVVQAFVGELKPTLKRALQQGPVSAVHTCAEEAPKIATALSQNGWLVKRVSNKARNPEAKPDDWEQKGLQQLARNLAAGKSGPALNYSETIDGEFRYLQGQVTEAMCLICHGENIAPDIKAAIHQHFPDDAATGYVADELRGAISLRKPLSLFPDSQTR